LSRGRILYNNETYLTGKKSQIKRWGWYFLQKCPALSKPHCDITQTTTLLKYVQCLLPITHITRRSIHWSIADPQSNSCIFQIFFKKQNSTESTVSNFYKIQLVEAQF
jgi:hypothetical protein